MEVTASIVFSLPEVALDSTFVSLLIHHSSISSKQLRIFQTTQNKFHMAAVQEAFPFSALMKDPSVRGDHCLSSHRSRLATQNRLKLTSIAETILFCRRQDFALRGHRDDGMFIDDALNHGNFPLLCF